MPPRSASLRTPCLSFLVVEYSPAADDRHGRCDRAWVRLEVLQASVSTLHPLGDAVEVTLHS